MKTPNYGTENDNKKNLEQTLYDAIYRAEKAAKKAKKAVKKVKRAKLNIKASKKEIMALYKSSDKKADTLREEIIEIAQKAAKKNKALKKIAKLNQSSG